MNDHVDKTLSKLSRQRSLLKVMAHTLLLRRWALARPLRARAFHHNPATVLPSLVSTASPDFVEKASAMDALVSDLEKHLTAARLGGGPKALEKMRARGKKVPRDR